MVSYKYIVSLLPLVLAAPVYASPASYNPNAPLQEITKRQCSRTYTVVGGDTCFAIEGKTGVSDADLHASNPSINSGCTNLQIGQVLCLSGGSSGSCTQTYTVVGGDTCSVIESRTGVSDANLHAMNPAINSGCTNLQVGQVLCVSGGSGGGGGGGGGVGGSGTTYTGIATYYNPNGGFGACGSVLQNSDMIVGLGPAHYDGGAHCGKTVAVTYGGKTISVTVADLCPGCQGAEGIDLTEVAMSMLDANYIFDGKITVQWTLPN
ncbi:hypothetical protein R3P38DRAFT_1311455 [Favolaschia claudopus]|uniref:LysM domain-containing protein n=1 Tax=Favolaschia claudopus TaxID=2862362 RepID=A0AAW0AWQ3_9AGAR